MSNLKLTDIQIDFLFCQLKKIFSEKWDNHLAQNNQNGAVREEWSGGAIGMTRVEVESALRACNELKNSSRFFERVPSAEEFTNLGKTYSIEQDNKLKKIIKKFAESIKDPDAATHDHPRLTINKTETCDHRKPIDIPITMTLRNCTRFAEQEKPNANPYKYDISCLIAKENLTKMREIIDNVRKKKMLSKCCKEKVEVHEHYYACQRCGRAAELYYPSKTQEPISANSAHQKRDERAD